MSSTARSQSTDEDDLAAALTALLSRHGLSGDSDPARVARVRAKLELARDMEGIDTANIIEDGGGRPARRAAARVDFKCVPSLLDASAIALHTCARSRPLGLRTLGTLHDVLRS